MDVHLFDSWSSISVFLLSLLFAVSVAKFLTRKRKPANYPPGPALNHTPLVGYIPFIGRNAHKTMQRLGQSYGNVFSLEFGQTSAIVLNDTDAIRSVLQHDSLSGRPHDSISKAFSLNYHGLALAEGEFWAEQRRFTVHTMRDLGMGKSRLEELVLEQVDSMVERLGKSEVEPVSPQAMFAQMAASVVHVFLFGRAPEADDRNFRIVVLAFSNSDMISPISYFDVVPWLADLGVMRWAMTWFWNMFRVVVNALHAMIHVDLQRFQRASAATTSSPNSCLLEAFVKKQMEERQRGCSIAKLFDSAALVDAATRGQFEQSGSSFSNLQLVTVAIDLFVAGIDTTASTLSWAVVLMLHYPQVARQCREELDRIVGVNRQVNMSDRAQLPFVEATLYEVMRYRPMVPLSLFHRTTHEVHYKEWVIPADSVVIPNLYAAMMDDKWWERPEEFNPKLHFIDSISGRVRVPKAFMPFSVGKRACLGESLARMELFLFFANLLLRFTWKVEDAMPSLEARKVNIFMKPQEYSVQFEARST